MNQLYICSDNNGLIKIGITDEWNPLKRINSFSKEYQNEFDLILAIPVEKIKAKDLESFIHRIFNSQFLNVKFLYEQFNIVEFEKLVNSKADGYTEVFLSHPILFANLLAYTNLLELTDISEANLAEVGNIESFPMKELFKKNSLHRKIITLEENNYLNLPRATALQNNMINGRVNVLRKNNELFFNQLNKESNISLEYKGDDTLIVSGKAKLSLNNFVTSNNNIEYASTLVHLSEKMKNNSAQEPIALKINHVKRIFDSVGIHTKDISVQKKSSMSNISGILNVSESQEIDLIVKYLDAICSLNIFKQDILSLIKYVKEEITSKNVLNYFPKYENKIERIFIDSINKEQYNDLNDGRKDLLLKVGSYIKKISNNESLLQLKEEINNINNLAKSLRNRDFKNSFFTILEEAKKSLTYVSTEILEGTDYKNTKLYCFLFSDEFKKPHSLFDSDIYIERKIHSISKEADLLENYVKNKIINIVSQPNIDNTTELHHFFNLEDFNSNENELNRKYVMESNVDGKTLEEFIDEKQNLALQYIRAQYIELLDNHHYSKDWRKIEEEFFEKYKVTEYHSKIKQELDEEFYFISQKNTDESKSYEILMAHYLIKNPLNKQHQFIVDYLSNPKNIKSATWSEEYILTECLKVFEYTGEKEIKEIMSEEIIFENNSITIKHFIATMQARHHVNTAKNVEWSMTHDYSCISCFDNKLISASNFFDMVYKWNQGLFSENGEFLYDKKLKWHQRSEKANSLLVVINILKNKEMFEEYELPKEFLNNISKSQIICEIIDKDFPEYKKYIESELTISKKVKC
jgi:hypothetical protein